MNERRPRAAMVRNVYKYVLKGATLEMGEGVYALVGPNGSGKTTLLRLLAGSIAPTRGEVRVYGRDPFRDHKVRSLIAYSASRPLAEGLEYVRDYLGLYYRVTPGDARWMEPRDALGEVGAEDLYDKRFYNLSEGQKRRVELAKLLLTKARVRLVDEPTTFLDEEARRRVISLLKRLGNEGLMVVATHDRELLENLKPAIVMLEGGKIAKVVTYDEAADMLKARRVYLVKARVRSKGAEPLERLKSTKGVRRAIYSINVESLLEKLGLSGLKDKATTATIVDFEEARRLAESQGMKLYTVSGIEVVATVEAEVYAESLANFIDFLMEKFSVEELHVSSPVRVAEA